MGRRWRASAWCRVRQRAPSQPWALRGPRSPCGGARAACSKRCDEAGQGRFDPFLLPPRRPPHPDQVPAVRGPASRCASSSPRVNPPSRDLALAASEKGHLGPQAGGRVCLSPPQAWHSAVRRRRLGTAAGSPSAGTGGVVLTQRSGPPAADPMTCGQRPDRGPTVPAREGRGGGGRWLAPPPPLRFLTYLVTFTM